MHNYDNHPWLKFSNTINSLSIYSLLGVALNKGYDSLACFLFGKRFLKNLYSKISLHFNQCKSTQVHGWQTPLIGRHFHHGLRRIQKKCFFNNHTYKPILSWQGFFLVRSRVIQLVQRRVTQPFCPPTPMIPHPSNEVTEPSTHSNKNTL